MIQSIHRQFEMNIQRFLESMFRFSENYIQIDESFFYWKGNFFCKFEHSYRSVKFILVKTFYSFNLILVLFSLYRQVRFCFILTFQKQMYLLNKKFDFLNEIIISADFVHASKHRGCLMCRYYNVITMFLLIISDYQIFIVQ